jgi:hypothetical protein
MHWQLQPQLLQAGLMSAGCQVLLGYLPAQQKAAAEWQQHHPLQQLGLLQPIGMALALLVVPAGRLLAAVTHMLGCSARLLLQLLEGGVLRVALSCGGLAATAH